jgi:8-oxo-dGTP pyrophosphatase MutT (NUDIX family)
LGAHANGYVADAHGRPSCLWIAQRALTKATDPGKFDNLIGGGVPDGQTPAQALVREGWEEAGLPPERLRDARAAGVLCLQRDIPEGLQHEWLHAWDLPLPAGLQPVNQDGEVAAFRCLPCDEALALAAGDAMTVDAALVTLDFALRHALLPAAQARALADALAPRRVENVVQAF